MTLESPLLATAAELRDQMRAALARDFSVLLQRFADSDEPSFAASGPLPAPSGSALDTLATLFQLTGPERWLLTLAAGAQLSPEVAAEIARRSQRTKPDLSLALALFGSETWDALCPAAPLRRARLLELEDSGPMLGRGLALDERVLHFLMGLNYLDARLEGIVEDLSRASPQDPWPSGTDESAARRLRQYWSVRGPVPVLMMAGTDRLAMRTALRVAADKLGLTLFRLDAADIPQDWAQRHALAVYLDREMALSDGAVLIEFTDAESHAAARLADLLTGPTALAGPEPHAPERDPHIRIDIEGPDPVSRRAIWRAALGRKSEALDVDINRLAEQFALDHAGIHSAVDSVDTRALGSEALMDCLWQAAREQGRQRLGGLAKRIVSTADWDDLVLPPPQMAQLRDLAGQVRETWRIAEEWGWRDKSPRGLGVAALFAGPSGTGKTFAAEILANRLGLDLYLIDLSQVVSKYIGETEKNLSRIFDAAEHGGAILLFDEADALFGKRSEVKDSHDRYANVEVSYLLQRMEAYRGLAILTTNQKSALDSAFLRRLRFVVQFPFPDANARSEIWARIFPASTPVDGLDMAKLGRMTLSGGAIRSAALNASYLAAAQNAPVRQEHVVAAARREYAKLEKHLTAAELGELR